MPISSQQIFKWYCSFCGRLRWLEYDIPSWIHWNWRSSSWCDKGFWSIVFMIIILRERDFYKTSTWSISILHFNNINSGYLFFTIWHGVIKADFFSCSQPVNRFRGHSSKWSMYLCVVYLQYVEGNYFKLEPLMSWTIFHMNYWMIWFVAALITFCSISL